MEQGTYSVTLTGSNGCDSVATLNLAILPTTTSTTNQNVCPTPTALYLERTNYNGAGTYSVTLTGSNGLRFCSNANPCDTTNNNQYNEPKRLSHSITLIYLERTNL